MLYSQNVFHIDSPEQLICLNAQIGPGNLKKLHIRVPYHRSAAPWAWVECFNTLANEAKGLRDIEILWDLLPIRNGKRRRLPSKRGLGDNPDVVRALGRIRGLEKCVIQGYYAEQWPAYVSERMGVRVQAVQGRVVWTADGESVDFGKRERDEWPPYEAWIRERELLIFEEFQHGIRDPIP